MKMMMMMCPVLNLGYETYGHDTKNRNDMVMLT